MNLFLWISGSHFPRSWNLHAWVHPWKEGLVRRRHAVRVWTTASRLAMKNGSPSYSFLHTPEFGYLEHRSGQWWDQCSKQEDWICVMMLCYQEVSRQADPAAYLRFISFCCCCCLPYLRFQPGDKSPCSARASERARELRRRRRKTETASLSFLRRLAARLLRFPLSFLFWHLQGNFTLPYTTSKNWVYLTSPFLSVVCYPSAEWLSFKLAPTSHMEASYPQYFSCMEIAWCVSDWHDTKLHILPS